MFLRDWILIDLFYCLFVMFMDFVAIMDTKGQPRGPLLAPFFDMFLIMFRKGVLACFGSFWLPFGSILIALDTFCLHFAFENHPLRHPQQQIVLALLCLRS